MIENKSNPFKDVKKWSELMSKSLKDYYHWDRHKTFNNPEPFKKLKTNTK